MYISWIESHLQRNTLRRRCGKTTSTSGSLNKNAAICESSVNNAKKGQIISFILDNIKYNNGVIVSNFSSKLELRYWIMAQDCKNNNLFCVRSKNIIKSTRKIYAGSIFVNEKVKSLYNHLATNINTNPKIVSHQVIGLPENYTTIGIVIGTQKIGEYEEQYLVVPLKTRNSFLEKYDVRIKSENQIANNLIASLDQLFCVNIHSTEQIFGLHTIPDNIFLKKLKSILVQQEYD